MLVRGMRLFRRDSEEKNRAAQNQIANYMQLCFKRSIYCIFVIKGSILPKHLLTAYFCNKQTSFRTLALSMMLFCHRRCHLTIIDTTCNGNEMRLDQPQKGRSSDKCETVNALGICCYFEIKSN
ncbi:hypothetical protein T06_12069, partial [Trichinella sp. T6]